MITDIYIFFSVNPLWVPGSNPTWSRRAGTSGFGLLLSGLGFCTEAAACDWHLHLLSRSVWTGPSWCCPHRMSWAGGVLFQFCGLILYDPFLHETQSLFFFKFLRLIVYLYCMFLHYHSSPLHLLDSLGFTLRSHPLRWQPMVPAS